MTLQEKELLIAKRIAEIYTPRCAKCREVLCDDVDHHCYSEMPNEVKNVLVERN